MHKIITLPYVPGLHQKQLLLWNLHPHFKIVLYLMKLKVIVAMHYVHRAVTWSYLSLSSHFFDEVKVIQYAIICHCNCQTCNGIFNAFQWSGFDDTQPMVLNFTKQIFSSEITIHFITGTLKILKKHFLNQHVPHHAASLLVQLINSTEYHE